MPAIFLGSISTFLLPGIFLLLFHIGYKKSTFLASNLIWMQVELLLKKINHHITFPGNVLVTMWPKGRKPDTEYDTF